MKVSRINEEENAQTLGVARAIRITALGVLFMIALSTLVGCATNSREAIIKKHIECTSTRTCNR